MTNEPNPKVFRRFSKITYIINPETEPTFVHYLRGQSVPAGTIHKLPCKLLALYQHGEDFYADIELPDRRNPRTVFIQKPFISHRLQPVQPANPTMLVA